MAMTTCKECEMCGETQQHTTLTDYDYKGVVYVLCPDCIPEKECCSPQEWYKKKQKMNNTTHKVIVATSIPSECVFAIPIDWKIEDIYVRYESLYYKDVLQEDVPFQEFESNADDTTIKEDDLDEYEDYFVDCE